jgi:hypothetical protein
MIHPNYCLCGEKLTAPKNLGFMFGGVEKICPVAYRDWTRKHLVIFKETDESDQDNKELSGNPV